MSTTQKLHLPILTSIEIRNFTLYSRQDVIKINFKSGAFCLAGANGLGKSTFISILNYAITGAVPIPDRPFKSADEYHKLSNEFARTFFDGRVDEDSRDTAEVRVEFNIGEKKISVTRNFFEVEAIRELRILEGSSPIALDEFTSEQSLNEFYQEQIAEAVGLDVKSQEVVHSV